MMSDEEIREYAWKSSMKHAIPAIEKFTAGWKENGPSKAAALAIMKMLSNMPVPGPKP